MTEVVGVLLDFV